MEFKMVRCKVSCGEFEIVIVERSMKEAANKAIRIHDQDGHTSKLGDLTLVEELNANNDPTGEHLFLGTKVLIENNTSEGYGTGNGQYIREHHFDADIKTFQKPK